MDSPLLGDPVRGGLSSTCAIMTGPYEMGWRSSHRSIGENVVSEADRPGRFMAAAKPLSCQREMASGQPLTHAPTAGLRG